MIIPNILEGVGNTPLITIDIAGYTNLNVFAKLEACNPTGSVKDRAASYILQKLLKNGKIDRDTVIMESTSGNFGVSLSAYCKYYGLRFIAVVDPCITSINEMLIRSNGAEVIKVTEPDVHGGYLVNRIKKIKELAESIPNSYWVNQYENPLNAAAYYHSLGKELSYQVEEIDFVFMGVSSGGTITGVSQKIKENFPAAKMVAVDVAGSVIFGRPSSKRNIPGIGSSIVPKILEEAFIDEVVIVNEAETISTCHELLEKYSFFVGGSSGSALAGIKKYFAHRQIPKSANVVTVFPDRGERYHDTIFNPEWCQKIKQSQQDTQLAPILL